MNTANENVKRGKAGAARRAGESCLAAALGLLLGLGGNRADGQAPSPNPDLQGAQVLTRGPVHEAFAGIVTFNPAPGIVVTKAPPAIIEEVPPEERPEGDHVTWIPGYWAWDDERSDFLWVSGTWRALPPGRAWMAGYWGKVAGGFQWTSGYWADAAVRETAYLPPPPATMEVGPNIEAPSPDYGWSPGCWIWYQGRYAWRPGYWAQGRADWDWTPAHYIWTPRGHIFVGGFWDYPVERRGILFAPVYFEPAVYAPRGFLYSPFIVIDLGVFSDHLFCRPRYSHYYFGDYYAPSYLTVGFYASFSFQSSRYGYDPVYSHQRWEHRQDREWEHRVQTSYQYRRDHETARPPRTWAAQRSINPSAPETKQNRVLVATSLDQLAKSKDSPMRFQPVAKEERQQLALRGQEVQKSREQRQTLEAKPADTMARRPEAAVEPAKVELPRSPIVAKPGKGRAPPKAQQAPKPDPKFQAKPEPPGRAPKVEQPKADQPRVDRTTPPAAPRKAEPEQKPAPGRSEPAPREKQAQPEPNRRPEVAPPHAQQGPPGKDGGSGKAEQRVAERPARPRPAQIEKGAVQLLKRNQRNEAKPKSSPPEQRPGPPPASP